MDFRDLLRSLDLSKTDILFLILSDSILKTSLKNINTTKYFEKEI